MLTTIPEVQGSEPKVKGRASRLAVILSWPDVTGCTDLEAWLARHFRPDRIWRVRDPQERFLRGQVDVVRCRVAARCLEEAPAGVTEFLFADRDMRPDERTDPILEAAGDVVGAEYPVGPHGGRPPRPWATPDEIHVGLVRVSRRVLEVLAGERTPEGHPVPLFAFARSRDNRAVLACECQWFARRCRRAGFTLGRAGWSDHGAAL